MMSHTRTHKHAPKPSKKERLVAQKIRARQRRENELLKERYADNEQPRELDAPRYRP